LNNLVIASVSLGAERTFIMSPRMPSKARKATPAVSAEGGQASGVGSGDLMVLDEKDLKDRKNVRWR
jgi:hypothetical protein